MDSNNYLQKIREYYEGNEDELNRLSVVIDFVLSKNENICRYDFESLVAFKPDMDTLMAAFLSDTFEEDGIAEEEVKKMCGVETLNILNGLKKIHSLKFEENDKKSQLDVLKKIFLTMAKDMRVILIALAQRLYVMENLGKIQNMDLRMKIARETLSLYVPIADRLGVYRMKVRLEDLSFRYVNSETFKTISTELEVFGKSRDRTISIVKRTLEDFLQENGVVAEVSGRVKSVYSIHKKYEARNINNFSDLFDIFAMRVIVDTNEIEKLYQILGMIHSSWKPVLKRFKDYVSNPKPNGYRSLHTIVLGLVPKDETQPVEIQIRTQEMHLKAEFGVASHWFYKKVGSSVKSEVVNSQSAWLKGLNSIKVKVNNQVDDIKKVELDIFKDRIFVLTPRGEVRDLPLGANPIDFAYNVHTEVGNRTYMAKVNGKVVPLDYKLENGDVVQIVTRVESQPKLEWLSFVSTSLAKSCIKAWFNALNSEGFIREGKKLLNKHLERFGKDLLDQNYMILKNYNGGVLNLSERENLLEEIGKGAQMPADVVRKLYPDLKNTKSVKKSVKRDVDHKSIHSKKDAEILIGGEAGLPIKIAGCCVPKNGNEIIAYVTRGSSVTIHKKTCLLLRHLDSERLISADWKVEVE